jgi:hypothetical protein
MRRALNTRDKGCVVCGAPPIMCDAHHLISWIDGGETKISNLVLLCRRHHTDLHHGHWTITITDGQVHVDRPTWADPPRQPNPHHVDRPTWTDPPPRPDARHADCPTSTDTTPCPDSRHADRPTWTDPPPRPHSRQSTAPRPDDGSRGDSSLDVSLPDHAAAGDPPPNDPPPPDYAPPDYAVAGGAGGGDLSSAGDGGMVPPGGSVRAVSGDAVEPAVASLMFAADGGRFHDEAQSAPAQDEAAAVRDATYLAIWGERPPAGRQIQSARGLPESSPFDPWGESDDLTPAATASDPP